MKALLGIFEYSCRNVGGKMAVASDSAQLDRMMESVTNTSSGRCLYAG